MALQAFEAIETFQERIAEEDSKSHYIGDGIWDISECRHILIMEGAGLTEEESNLFLELVTLKELWYSKPYQVDGFVLLDKMPINVEEETKLDQDGMLGHGVLLTLDIKRPMKLLIANEND